MLNSLITSPSQVSLGSPKSQAAQSRNISILWDFDGTLSPDDSTTKVVDILDVSNKSFMGPLQETASKSDFWSLIKSLRGDQGFVQNDENWQHIIASDAPIWMYALARVADLEGIALTSQFFKEIALPTINLFPEVTDFLINIKRISDDVRLQKLSINIHHFIISAGLKELIELVFPPELVTFTFGCRYTVIANKENPEQITNVPSFCMDETMKTRAIFEIAKGSFNDRKKTVNRRVEKSDLFCSFENMIYVGDGPTDVPSLSLVRSKGGMGVAIFDPNKTQTDVNKRFKEMRLDRRADLITEASFASGSVLDKFIRTRIEQLVQRAEAENSAAL